VGLTDNSENESIEGDFDHGNGSTVIPAQGYGLLPTTEQNSTKFSILMIQSSYMYMTQASVTAWEIVATNLCLRMKPGISGRCRMDN